MQLRNKRLFQKNPYIGGHFLQSTKAGSFSVFNPFNNEKLAEVANCGREETTLAIDKANEAFESWRNLSGIERSKILKKWYELLIENQESESESDSESDSE